MKAEGARDPLLGCMHAGRRRAPHLDGGMRCQQVERVLHVDELLLDGTICAVKGTSACHHSPPPPF